MLRLGISAPSPEVASCKVATLLGIVAHQSEHVLIESVAPLGWCAQSELKSIARVSELLHHKRFLNLGAYVQVSVYILLGVLLGAWQVLYQRVRLGPSPVVWPQVYVGVVYVLISRYALPAVKVALAAPCALATYTYQVVGVQTAYQRRCLAQPLLEGGQSLFAECARFVTYLPAHNGRIVLIRAACIAVGAPDDKLHVVVEQLVRLLVGSIFAHGLHKCRIASVVGAWLLTLACMLQIESVAAAPFPRVVQV